MERETFTSTKLQLRVYTDAQCSQPYDDEQTARKHAVKGYDVNGTIISTSVSFRPPFYSCLTCTPESVSGTFNKKNGNWYDDDYISEHNAKANDDEADGDDGQNGDDAVDDQYFSNNDDVSNDDGNYNNGNYNSNYNQYNNGDDYYNDDGGRSRSLAVSSTAVKASHVPVLLGSHSQTSLLQIHSLSPPLATTYRLIMMSFGRSMMRCRCTVRCTTTITMLESGTCVNVSSSTAFGATKNADPWISFERTSGRDPTFCCCPSCLSLSLL
jgi:hypothetical protein